MDFMFFYVIIINIIAFLLMLIDKRRAIAGRRRIPERTLFFVTLIGGACGGLAGMFLFRHKTKHLSFRILLPLFFLIHVILIYLLCRGGIL